MSCVLFLFLFFLVREGMWEWRPGCCERGGGGGGGSAALGRGG